MAQTRDAILHALADEILDRGIHGLSAAGIAARAEISERTVYRHFPSVEAMIESLNRYVGERLTDELDGVPRLGSERDDPIDALIDTLPKLYDAFDEIGAPARASAAVTLARGSDEKRQARRDRLGEALNAELSHLESGEGRAIVETLYMLAGSVSWFLLTRSGELTGRQAGEAAARIARAVIADLRAERKQVTERTAEQTEP